MNPRRPSERLEAIACALAAAIGYGAVGIFVRLVLDGGVALPVVLAWRFGLSALLLLPFVARRVWRAPGRALVSGVALGAFGFALQSMLYLSAVARIGAGRAAVLLYLYPALVVLLEWAMRGVRPTAFRLMLLAMSIAGCVLTAYVPQAASAEPFIGMGVGLGLATAIVYAVYLLAADRIVRGIDPLTASFTVCSGATISFAIMAVTSNEQLMPPSAASGALLVGLALVCTLFPMAGIFAAIRRIGPTGTSLISTAEPLCAAALGAVVLGEQLAPAQLVGGALVVTAAALFARSPA